MTPRRQATRAAVDLIKRFEGFRSKAARLPDDGGWTIGYGHTRTAREGAEIDEADADALLIYDIAAVVTALNEWVYSPLTQNQFDALAAFAFNVGLPNFRRSSVLRRLNEGQPLQAACAMEMWRTADFEGERIVIDALVRRRSAEMALFLTPQDGYIPVPSLIVRPRVDEAVARAAPAPAAEVRTPLEGEIAASVRTGDLEPPSASRAAADSISARLDAILHEHGVDVADLRPAAPEAPEPEAPAEHAPERAPGLAADAKPVAEAPAVEPPAPAANDGVAAEILALDRPPGLDNLSLRPTLDLEPIAFNAQSFAAARRARRQKSQPPSPVVAALGVAGLGVAGAGVLWGVSAHASERMPLPLLQDPATAGWGVGVVGAGIVASSVYVLIKRLAARGE